MRRPSGFKVSGERLIVIKWIIDWSENLVLNHDYMTIGLNEDVDPISFAGGYFALHRNITVYRFSLILNTSNLGDSIQKQRSKPVEGSLNPGRMRECCCIHSPYAHSLQSP